MSNIQSPNNIFELEKQVKINLTDYYNKYRLWLTCEAVNTNIRNAIDTEICLPYVSQGTRKNEVDSAKNTLRSSLTALKNALTNIKNNPNGKNNSQYNNDYVQIINNYNEIVSTRQSLDAKLAELYEIGDTKSNFYQKKLISTSYTKIILTVLATALVVTAFIVAKNKA